MKILFNGIGPNDTITFNGKIYRNGSVVDMEDGFAAAYIDSHLAVGVETKEDEREAEALQKLEIKNIARRKAIKEKADGGDA